VGSPLRILHVVVNMNRGGAETLLMNLYRNVDRTKVQFDFLTCKPGVFDDEIRDLGGQVHRIPYVTDVGHQRYMQSLVAFFTKHPEYSIVHAHMDKMSGIVLRAAQKAGVRVRIAHSHNTSSEGGLAARAYKWIAGRWIAPSATHLLACSRKAAEWLFPQQEQLATILKNGIECDQYAYSPELRRKAREELGIRPEQFVVGHVGRFNEQKNHVFLIDVFAKLQQVHSEALLILAGDGTLRAEMERKVQSLGLTERVHFLGVRSDIPHLLQAFDVFVFPSWHEGLPVTLVEAQGAGLPCLISDAITREVDMELGLVRYLPLITKDRWVEELLELSGREHPRRIPETALARKGYDIRSTAAWTEGFYTAILR
jgi:glycosyltransferase involved in cell wall biosynthesis